MHKLVLFDTKKLSFNYVLNNVKDHNVFYAKYGKKIVVGLLLVLIGIIIASTAVYRIEVDKHIKEMNAISAEYEFKYTQVEKSELHYLIGFLYAQTNQIKPDKDTVYKFIKDCNSWYPEYIMAQAIIESSCGTSELAKNTNNLFGMKAIDQSNKRHRPTTQIPGASYNGYGVYKNWQLSVIDRILWELWRFKEKKPTIEQYQNALYNYAEAEEYVQTTISVANKYKNK